MSIMDGPSVEDERVLASMTRDQLILFSKLHDAHGDLRRKNEQLRAELESNIAESQLEARQRVALYEENTRLKQLAFGAGMALAGVVPMRGYAADLLTAQDLIKQMLEES